jgi:Glycosyl hydrolases family 39
MMRIIVRRLIQITLLMFLVAVLLRAGEAPTQVRVDWGKVLRVSRTSATLQVVVNPMIRPGHPMHDAAFRALHNLGCDMVRYVPWLPYPKLSVAELDPPKGGKTSWDFSLIDPMMADFMEATAGHSVLINFSAIPQWMWKTEKPVPYPADPDQVTWTYEQGTELHDPSMKELADYYARLVSWYTQGGFTDEYGVRHKSDHHYKIDNWEVFNEVDDEHAMTPQQYTAYYDAIVQAILRVAPRMKFAGLALDNTSRRPDFFEYFLDHSHHKPGIPLDIVAYHFYANATAEQSPEVMQYTFFERADHFLDAVRYIEVMRQRLSPETQTDVDELGSNLPDDGTGRGPDYVPPVIPHSYWNLSGALYAYVYAELAKLGIEYAGESQLVGYPTQWPSVTMIDWETGQPNARYWVLKLIHDNFDPGDKLVETHLGASNAYALGFVTRDGKRKVLLVNKHDRTFAASIPGAAGGKLEVVDQQTGFQPPETSHLSSDEVMLNGLAVGVVTLPK